MASCENKYTTLLDLSRQAKVITGETACFDGKIEVGIPFSGYPTGVDTNTIVSLGFVSSESAVFSGNTGTTVFDASNTGSTNYNAIFSGYSGTVWTNALFSGNTSGLTLPITTISADTQVVGADIVTIIPQPPFTALTTGPIWTLTQTATTSNGEHIIGIQYTGYTITYSFRQVETLSVTAYTAYSGLTNATQENFSAGTLDYKGPLDYLSTMEDATVVGRLTTDKLTVTGGASASTIGYVLTQLDSTGKAGWAFNSASASTNTFVTGGTLTGTNLDLTWNTGGSVPSIELSGLTSPWTSGTGTNSAVLIGGGNIASGITSVAEGTNTVAGGDYSHAEGRETVASGDYSHAEGFGGVASGDHSHAEGRFTVASNFYSHAEGISSVASGSISHAEGNSTVASGDYSHAEGSGTVASNNNSHAEGNSTIASGSGSHAEGVSSVASGGVSHAEGFTTVAGGGYSHAGGFESTASGLTSFIHSANSLVTGDRSVVLGGQNITGTTDDTVYVPNLNIGTVGGGASVNNLGIDANGNVVTGTAGGGGATIDPYQNEGNVSEINWDVSGTSTNYEATLTGVTTLNMSNVRNGDYGTLIVTQDGTGSRTLSFGGGTNKVVNGGGGTPTLTATAGATDILSFTYNGSTFYWTVGNDYT